MTDSSYRRREEPSGWAFTGVAFAACMLLMVGSFQIITGLAAIFNDDFFVVARNYTFDLDTSAWGVIHLLIGALLAFTGWALFANKTWAIIVALGLAIFSAIANFFFIPYYPFWSIVVIALDVWIVWALTRPGIVRD
jgi:hypothetical protein